MKKDIFIDGETGTTGLQVHQKLNMHPNINIMPVDQSKRKDISYKKEMLAKSDVTFLCLPDEVSIETVQIADELGDMSPIIIDASTAHRTNPNWSYGLPELGENYRKNLENSKSSKIQQITKSVDLDRGDKALYEDVRHGFGTPKGHTFSL